MNPALRVISPGFLTAIQDLGRPGYQHLGIPVSGALDPVSLQAANALVGNAPGSGALEVTYVGPTLGIEADDVRMSFVGAKAVIEILPNIGASAGTLIETMESIHLRRGDIVRVGSLRDSKTLYVAVEGGFDIVPVLGSVSTYIRGSIGGWQGRSLIAGDLLPLVRNTAAVHDEFRLEGLDLSAPERFRVIAGPQSDYFTERALEDFFDNQYTVDADSDRMGMRLDGRQVTHARGFNITSDAVAPGSIQIPGDGKPIVLLADRQTIGGYPKIATVISADLPALARLPIGAKLSFEPVTMDDAVAARRRLLAEIGSISGKIVPLTRAGMDTRLRDVNLISGIVDGHGDWAA